MAEHKTSPEYDPKLPDQARLEDDQDDRDRAAESALSTSGEEQRPKDDSVSEADAR